MSEKIAIACDFIKVFHSFECTFVLGCIQDLVVVPLDCRDSNIDTRTIAQINYVTSNTRTNFVKEIQYTITETAHQNITLAWAISAVVTPVGKNELFAGMGYWYFGAGH